MTQQELNDLLKLHEKWLNHDSDGKRLELVGVDLQGLDLSFTNLSNADLRYANLSFTNLSNAGLRYANLSFTNLSDADLRYADLRFANLNNANLSNAGLRYANLSKANLSDVNLSNTNLRCANLSFADLRGADLTNADLSFTNLSNANLRFANLNNIYYNENTAFFAMCCPEKGSFIGYKKCSDKIVELKILASARRSSATNRKCRCDKAKVLSITNLDGTDTNLTKIKSNHDKNFIYEVGKTVEVKDFDEDRWVECSSGIHFFITRDEAVRYN